MIIKKLAVPFINEKLLQQVEHCYIATAAISEAGFDFIRSRIPTKTKMEIVTGLDVLTSPEVLRKIWRHYQGRITLNIYTRNVFYANVYIFDLPYRKSVAFVGSGNFTLEGLKDGEELFYKVTDAKEIENLKSWFTGYFEFGEPLTEPLIEEYTLLYPTMKQRDHVSRLEKKQLVALTTIGFSWDNIKFKHQYFKKEDYLTFSNSKAPFNTPEIMEERVSVQNKLLELHEQVKGHLHKLRLYEAEESAEVVSSLDPQHHADRRVQRMWLAYGPSSGELREYDGVNTLADVMNLQIALRQKDVTVSLVVGTSDKAKTDREHFNRKMNDPEYRKQFFTLLIGLGAGYVIDVGCERKSIEFFQNEEALWEFTKADQWMYYSFVIEKSYSPGETELSNDNIVPTIMKEVDKVALVYEHVRTSLA